MQGIKLFLVEKENSLVDVYEKNDSGLVTVEYKGFELKCNTVAIDVCRDAYSDSPDFMELYKQAA